MDQKEKNSGLVPAAQHKGEWQKPRLSQLSVDDTQGGTNASDFDSTVGTTSYFDASGS